MGGLTGKKVEFKSQVPHVMLHLNPGVARQFNQHASKLNKLKLKVIFTTEERRYGHNTILIAGCQDGRKPQNSLCGAI